MSNRLALGENHRRAVSVLLRGLEQMCEEIEACLEAKPGLLRRVDDDLSSAQRGRLAKMVERVRSEIRRLHSEIELDVAVRSPRRAIRALLSVNVVNLEESDSARLRGYGAIPREVAQRLDQELSGLKNLLEQMVELVEHD